MTSKLYPGTWCDLCAGPNGVYLVRFVNGKTICHSAGDDTRIEWEHHTRTFNHIACVWHNELGVIAVGQADWDKLGICQKGSFEIRNDIPAFGTGSVEIGIDDNNHVIILSQTSPTTYVRLNYSLGTQTDHLIPIGRTSQGFLQFRPLSVSDTITWQDTDREYRTVDGKTLILPQRFDDWAAGQLGDSLAYTQQGTTVVVTNRFSFPPKLIIVGNTPHIVAPHLNNELGYYVGPFHEALPPAPVAAYQPKPFGKKLWMAPFFEVGNRYGDTQQPLLGNAITVVEPGVAARVARRFGKPMITTVDAYDSQYDNLIIAYWVSGGTMEELRGEYFKALRLPEKPIIAYLDGRGWPSTCPSWMLGNRTWLGVQAYRGETESLSEFTHQMEKILGGLYSWNLPIMLTPQFYDRNGTVGVSHALANMPVYEKLINEHYIVGMMPFADRRPGGMKDHQVLADSCWNFTQAVPDRPNRHDYWTPKSVDMITTLRNKLQQSTSMLVLSVAEKQYLLSRLGGT